MKASPLHLAIAASVALCAALVAPGCQTERIGAPCNLEPCGTPAGSEPDNANAVCDLQVECESFTCLSYRSDGNNDRAPFCTAGCAPDPGCDPLDPQGCLNAGGDPYSNCPRDPNGNPGVCLVTNEVIGPKEPTNCMVTIAGVPRESRCACVPCCLIDPNLCRDPGECG